jgi:hypothetical protein
VYRERIYNLSVNCAKEAAKRHIKVFLEMSTSEVYDSSKVGRETFFFFLYIVRTPSTSINGGSAQCDLKFFFGKLSPKIELKHWLFTGTIQRRFATQTLDLNCKAESGGVQGIAEHGRVRLHGKRIIVWVWSMLVHGVTFG